MARKLPYLMTPGEVSAAFKVSMSTPLRWARQGKLRTVRLPGQGDGPGDHRYYAAQVAAMIAGQPLTEAQLDALVRGEES